jgi:hypothetical protein
VGAIVALVAIVLASTAFVLLVRRRRRPVGRVAAPTLGARRDTHDAEAW